MMSGFNNPFEQASSISSQDSIPGVDELPYLSCLTSPLNSSQTLPLPLVQSSNSNPIPTPTTPTVSTPNLYPQYSVPMDISQALLEGGMSGSLEQDPCSAFVSALAKQFQETTAVAQTQAMLQLLIPLMNQNGGMDLEEAQKFQKPGNKLYKTEMCRSFEETGVCKYGKKCQYAHGGEELRATAKHPKHKTIACETILKGGVCPYGKRCRFIHPSDNENAPASFAQACNVMAKQQQRRLPVFQSLTVKDQYSA
eukprot:TRINITY_DN818_c0_g2_i3.p1 TRINITY_DN818_c0_g2~~TRINITY_DN818_c0_g2_i3.p1  ORF type:complete len:253 (+),score=43.02 TRINITY_DN818_c0_g2_i3:98-856(+)